VITAKNNIAIRNTHVQTLSGGSEKSMRFYVVGTPDDDSLTVTRDLAGGEVRFLLPVQALPWRDRSLLEEIGARRPLYTGRRARDPLATLQANLNGKQAQTLTGVGNALEMRVANGIAEFTMGEDGPLHIPRVQLAEGARIVASVHVTSPQVAGRRRFVHVAQRSGGQLAGGVSLELRES
jgi:hypothetical protein